MKSLALIIRAFADWTNPMFAIVQDILTDVIFTKSTWKGSFAKMKDEHEVCENCPYKLEDIGEFSDGYHTFNSLYHQRAVLWAIIVHQNKERAWKTRFHEDGKPCFGGGWFLVTVDTPEGAYGYHYENKYWDMFDCEELPKAKPWDGYTDEDVHRLFSLE